MVMGMGMGHGTWDMGHRTWDMGMVRERKLKMEVIVTYSNCNSGIGITMLEPQRCTPSSILVDYIQGVEGSNTLRPWCLGGT